MLMGKIKNIKTAVQSLWNIAKYFNKLLKQVQNKSNNKDKDNIVVTICEFFNYYAN